MLYPLKFEPIFKSMLWGGDRLRSWLNKPPSPDPTGEAWVVSDVDGSESVVANGSLSGRTLRSLVHELRADPQIATKLSLGRFPLLCKFLDTRQELSVQVHPNDEQANARHPGQAGKTEAWVILEADPATSRIYAGFKTGVTAETFRAALGTKSAASLLHSFTPAPGDCIFLPAGTVHAIGANLRVFEVQQTSDITYRLYDWDRIDAKTGKPRQLHVEDGLACSNFAAGPCRLQIPVIENDLPVKRERLVACEYFTINRVNSTRRFTVGAKGESRIVVAISADGRSELEAEDVDVYNFSSGDVYFIPADVGECSILPAGPVTVLEVGLGEPRQS
jgi:mannose-6-phosphate isomerase